MRTVLLVLLAVCLAACRVSEPDAGERERDVAALLPVVPLVEDLQVEDFNNRDWCRHLTYARGEFTDDVTEEGCNDWQGDPQLFDDQAEVDFDALVMALRATGIEVLSVGGTYEDGRAISIDFSVEHLTWSYWSYVYAPGQPMPENEDLELRTVRINDDWYWQWVDWN